jgi:hypothetical protein
VDGGEAPIPQVHRASKGKSETKEKSELIQGKKADREGEGQSTAWRNKMAIAN